MHSSVTNAGRTTSMISAWEGKTVLTCNYPNHFRWGWIFLEWSWYSNIWLRLTQLIYCGKTSQKSAIYKQVRFAEGPLNSRIQYNLSINLNFLLSLYTLFSSILLCMSMLLLFHLELYPGHPGVTAIFNLCHQFLWGSILTLLVFHSLWFCFSSKTLSTCLLWDSLISYHQ